MIDGEINAGRGDMRRGFELTWRCNAPLARDLTGTWAAAAAAALAASSWAAAIHRSQRIRMPISIILGGLNIAREQEIWAGWAEKPRSTSLAFTNTA